MKQIKITGENRKSKLKELLSHFYTEDLDRYTEAQLIEMYDALGYYKISKNNFDIICMRRDAIKENDMWTKEQQKYLDDMKNEIKNDIIEIMDRRFAEQDAKFDVVFELLGKITNHLGIK